MKKSEFTKVLCEKRLLLPPLSGFTDYPYRQILAKFNPPFIITEMVNARAVIEKNKKTLQMLEKTKGNHFKGAQLVGKDPDVMAKAAVIIERLGFDYVDINMGCTVKKVVLKGQGVALMKDETLACNIVETVSNTVDIPIIVKMRAGFSEKSINVVSLSQKLEKSGASAITIHGRSGERKFGLKIDYDIIRAASVAVSVPIVANGGVFSGEDAKNILQKTNASAVMPGRGIIGNPWIINDILSTFEGDSISHPTLDEKKKIVLEHATNLCNFYGEKSGIIKMRKIFPRYFTSCMYLNCLKADVKEVSTRSEVELLLSEIKEKDGILSYR